MESNKTQIKSDYLFVVFIASLVSSLVVTLVYWLTGIYLLSTGNGYWIALLLFSFFSFLISIHVYKFTKDDVGSLAVAFFLFHLIVYLLVTSLGVSLGFKSSGENWFSTMWSNLFSTIVFAFLLYAMFGLKKLLSNKEK